MGVLVWLLAYDFFFTLANSKLCRENCVLVQTKNVICPEDDKKHDKL